MELERAREPSGVPREGDPRGDKERDEELRRMLPGKDLRPGRSGGRGRSEQGPPQGNALRPGGVHGHPGTETYDQVVVMLSNLNKMVRVWEMEVGQGKKIFNRKNMKMKMIAEINAYGKRRVGRQETKA